MLDDDDDIGQLQFPHLISDDYEINPSVIVPHDANKLKGMYGHLRSAYKVAYANWKKSGTHDSDFGNFCNGQMDVLYLHQFVCLYPECEVSVSSMIPSHIGVSSSDSGTFSNSPTPKSGCRKRKGNDDRVVSLMKALDSSAMRTEVAKKKIERMSDLSTYRNERIKLEKSRKNDKLTSFISISSTWSAAALGNSSKRRRQRQAQRSRQRSKIRLHYLKKSKPISRKKMSIT